MPVDLTQVLHHLRTRHPQLSERELRDAETEYRNFLARGVTCPELCVAPEAAAGLMWQAHAAMR